MLEEEVVSPEQGSRESQLRLEEIQRVLACSPTDYKKILDLSPSETLTDKELTRAYRRVIRLIHPDYFGAKNSRDYLLATRTSQIVNEAYQKLKQSLSEPDFVAQKQQSAKTARTERPSEDQTLEAIIYKIFTNVEIKELTFMVGVYPFSFVNQENFTNKTTLIKNLCYWCWKKNKLDKLRLLINQKRNFIPLALLQKVKVDMANKRDLPEQNIADFQIEIYEILTKDLSLGELLMIWSNLNIPDIHQPITSDKSTIAMSVISWARTPLQLELLIVEVRKRVTDQTLDRKRVSEIFSVAQPTQLTIDKTSIPDNIPLAELGNKILLQYNYEDMLELLFRVGIDPENFAGTTYFTKVICFLEYIHNAWSEAQIKEFEERLLPLEKPKFVQSTPDSYLSSQPSIALFDQLLEKSFADPFFLVEIFFKLTGEMISENLEVIGNVNDHCKIKILARKMIIFFMQRGEQKALGPALANTDLMQPINGAKAHCQSAASIYYLALSRFQINTALVESLKSSLKLEIEDQKPPLKLNDQQDSKYQLMSVIDAARARGRLDELQTLINSHL